MKKLLIMIMALMLIAPVANAQSDALNKALKKEYKTKMKEYKKEGWKVFGTSRSFEVVLLSHYEKLNNLGDNGYELVGIASKFKSKNIGHQEAINNACNTYAQQAGSHVRGRVLSDMASNSDDTSSEFDKFYGAYERSVEKEIKGELKESFSIIRELGDGNYEMQTYFIVNEDAASKARLRAYENAIKESKMAQEYADKVSQFVREGFKDETK